MIILPAIDVKDGRCVRLFQGDFSTAEQVAENHLQTAKSFEDAGAKWIHMVDLDGAKDAKPVNSALFLEVAKNTSLKVELGGGIRNMQTVEYYLSRGISRVILGSAAVQNPAFVAQAVKEFGEQIAIGIDAKNQMVAAEGWLDNSGLHYLELAKQMEQVGITRIIYTDISKDGTLSGPNLEQLDAINQAVSCDIIASGGIKELADIKALKELGLYGAICGKSIYSGSLSLKAAVGLAGDQTC